MTRTLFHHIIYLLGMIALAISIPLSHFSMGLTAFILMLNWLAEWNWKEKWERVKINKDGLFLPMLFLFCCIGLINTDLWPIALHNLLAKLPILLAPLMIITSKPFTYKEFRLIQWAFIGSTVFCCIYSFCYWMSHSIQDIRQISVFIDHIRFSLCIVLSIVFCCHLMLQNKGQKAMLNAVYSGLIVLQIIYMFIAQTLTGIIILFVIGLMFGLYLLLTMTKSRVKTAILCTIAMLSIVGVAYVGVITFQYFHCQDTEITERQTALGNDYAFDSSSIVENGHRVYDYVCLPEMEMAWAQRSDTAYSPLIEQTLIRYLNSKGLRKDAAAVNALSDVDVANVENKIANVDYTRRLGLHRAMYQTYFSYSIYKKYGNIEQSSLYQRFELWNASWNVIRNNWLLGVGLGDYKAELDSQLERQGSSIAHKHNRGSHNQFLTFWLMGGFLLVLCFVLVLAYPFWRLRNRITFLYVAYFVIMVLSMITEDTIESQPGRLLFAVFMPLLLYANVRGEEN